MLLEQETFDKYGYWPKDLYTNSLDTIIYKCDYCERIVDKKYKNYNAALTNTIKKDACRLCHKHKLKEVMIKKHGVGSTWEMQAIREKNLVSIVKHGMYKTRLYKIWGHMIGRCKSKDPKLFRIYLSKGIIVCDEWKNDFLKFKEWAENNGYKDDLTINRKNPDKNYCPENCEWVTRSENTKQVVIYRKQEKAILLKHISDLESILKENNISFPCNPI